MKVFRYPFLEMDCWPSIEIIIMAYQMQVRPIITVQLMNKFSIQLEVIIR